MEKIEMRGKYGIGKFALVDDEDFDEIKKYKWHLTYQGYAIRNVRVNGEIKHIFMHRVINKTPEGSFTDHINGIKLDNRKSNLRNCNNFQNMMNRKLNQNSSIGVKGLSVRKAMRKRGMITLICARIGVNGKRIYLGDFKTVAEASRAYAKASKEYHGKFARNRT